MLFLPLNCGPPKACYSPDSATIWKQSLCSWISLKTRPLERSSSETSGDRFREAARGAAMSRRIWGCRKNSPLWAPIGELSSNTLILDSSLSLAVLLEPLLGSTTLWQPWEMSRIGLCDHIWGGGRERHFYLWKKIKTAKNCRIKEFRNFLPRRTAQS